MGFEELRRRAFEKTTARVTAALSQQDALIVQAVRTVDTLAKASNVLFEKFRDWHAFYVPELAGFPLDAETYLNAALLGARKNYSAQLLEKIVGAELAGRISDAVQKSAGADFSEQDLEQLLAFANSVKSLSGFRKTTESYVHAMMGRECPNLSALCGGLLGARLIATAGSLKRLVEMPSSTIQVLGAEKALFAHLQKGTKPPKHGIIFQHPVVHNAVLKQRGKAARRLAARISLAAKTDFFKGAYCADRLCRELGMQEERIKE